jgi:hypothetical protein
MTYLSGRSTVKRRTCRKQRRSDHLYRQGQPSTCQIEERDPQTSHSHRAMMVQSPTNLGSPLTARCNCAASLGPSGNQSTGTAVVSTRPGICDDTSAAHRSHRAGHAEREPRVMCAHSLRNLVCPWTAGAETYCSNHQGSQRAEPAEINGLLIRVQPQLLH